jgi:hypothetical protein
MDLTRRQFTNIEPGKEFGRGPMNTFVNVPSYPPADVKVVVRANFDTLYSLAWLDLTKEPMIVSAPDTDGRFYLLPMLDMWTDVFASPGWRTPQGSPLTGSKRYVMRFQPGQLPDVKAFWSITMYDPTYNLVANPINRYSVGNRTAGLKADADGGLSLSIQDVSPGGEREANWLPSPTTGPFLMVLGAYIPSQAILDHTWHPPGIVPVS